MKLTKEKAKSRRRNAIQKKRKQKKDKIYSVIKKELIRFVLYNIIQIVVILFLFWIIIFAEQNNVTREILHMEAELTSVSESTEKSTVVATTVIETTEEMSSTITETTTEEISSTVIETVTEETTVINEEELELLAHLIYGEAGDQNDRCQRAVASVVMNRVAHKRYPNTIRGVIFQKGQYACTTDGNFDKKPSKQAYENAKWVLKGNNIFPPNVIYQSQFEQGDGIYEKIGTEIFCFE